MIEQTESIWKEVLDVLRHNMVKFFIIHLMYLALKRYPDRRQC